MSLEVIMVHLGAVWQWCVTAKSSTTAVLGSGICASSSVHANNYHTQCRLCDILFCCWHARVLSLITMVQ
jgi:hypothetical protein